MDYRNRVEMLARERRGRPIFNGSLEHAAIIVERMFAHAKKHVCILSGGMNARVYGPEETLEQAQLFLATTDHNVRILLEKPETVNFAEHPFFAKFRTAPNVEVRAVPPEIRDSYKYHFLEMDGDSYRFESDRTKHEAIAAFGEPKGAANMQKVFEVLWEHGTKVTWRPVATEQPDMHPAASA